MGAARPNLRRQKDIASHFLVSVSLTIVILGLANTMPGIPGLDNGIRELVESIGFRSEISLSNGCTRLLSA